MKFFLLLILLVVVSGQTGINAQTFAPTGAEWYYTNGSEDDLFEIGYVKITALGDTTINGEAARVLETKHVRKPGEEKGYHEYIKQSGSQISYYNPYLNQFIVLYDFSAEAGDTIIVHEGKTRVPPGFFPLIEDSINSFGYVIDQVDSILIDQVWRKRQRIKHLPSTNSNWGMSISTDTLENSIVETFGSGSYMFGCSRFVTPETNIPSLCCYSETSVNYKNPEWTLNCDYTYIINAVKRIDARESGMFVYPNPAITAISIANMTEERLSYQIIAVDGKSITGTVARNETIKTADLKPGVYFLQLSGKAGIVSGMRFCKQE